MTDYLPRIAERVLGVPLMIEPRKLRTILSALGSRIGVEAEVPEPEARGDRIDRLRERTDLRVEGGVAVIEIFGSLVHRHSFLGAMSGLSSYEQIGIELEKAAADPRVDSILLEVDSPGGEVNGVFDLADKIKAVAETKPVWAIAADTAASAAYVLASAADKLFVTQSGLTGSIGVIALRWDETGALDAEGLKVTEIFAGARKVDGSPLHALTDDELVALQGHVDSVYDLLVAKVAENRSVSEDTVRATEAAVFVGEDGIVEGLADGIATTDQLVAQLSANRTTIRPLAANREESMSENQDAAPEITAEYVKESHPEVAAELRAEGQAEGRTEGAAAERKRLESIEALAGPGDGELIAKLKSDPEMTAERAALCLVEAHKARRDAQVHGLEEDEMELDAPSAGSPELTGDAAAVAAVLNAGKAPAHVPAH